MSLVLAYHRGPADYLLASDTRFSTGPGGMALTAPKTVRAGDWLLGGVGAAPAWQWMARALVERLHTARIEVRDDLAIELLGAFRDMLPHAGPQEANRLPSVGCDVLGVGPLGIVWLDASGCIVWVEAPYHAVGCADAYALGWLDARGACVNPEEDLVACIAAAAKRFPGVGGPARVLEIAHGELAPG